MRHVIATPGLPYFHTTYLFHPFGTTIANHPHTALPALVAATLLKPASVVAAQNLLLIAYVFGNLAAMYTLAWDITRHAARASGCWPGCSACGDWRSTCSATSILVAAWVLPGVRARAALVRWRGSRTARPSPLARCSPSRPTSPTTTSSTRRSSPPSTSSRRGDAFDDRAPGSARHRGGGGCGVASHRPGDDRSRRPLSQSSRPAAARSPPAASRASATTPQNALTAMWIGAIGWVAVRLADRDWTGDRRSRGAGCGRRLGGRLAPPPSFSRGRRAAALAGGWTGRAPRVRHAAVSGWRSIPHGVDLLAPLLGHPLHPLMAAVSVPAYAGTPAGLRRGDRLDRYRPDRPARRRARRAARDPGGRARAALRGRCFAIAFAIFALGPFLMVGGFDTGLKLPRSWFASCRSRTTPACPGARWSVSTWRSPCSSPSRWPRPGPAAAIAGVAVAAGGAPRLQGTGPRLFA